MECLTELDLSYNCVMEHLSLWPLEKMSALLWISLEGNPLSYHPKYRLLAIKHLHPCLSNSKVYSNDMMYYYKNYIIIIKFIVLLFKIIIFYININKNVMI